MPHLFRTLDGTQWKPGQPIPLTLADGTTAHGVWAGSAQDEKLAWWLGKPGSDLGQTEEVAEIAVIALNLVGNSLIYQMICLLICVLIKWQPTMVPKHCGTKFPPLR